LIKGIIFDLGGTLIQFTADRDPIVREGIEAVATWYFKKKHIKIDTSTLVETFIAEYAAGREVAEQTQTEVLAQQTLRDSLDKIDAPPSTVPLVEAAIKIFFESEEKAYRPHHNAIETVKQLTAQGYRLGLYSNAPDDALVQRLVNKCSLRPWLSPTFSSAGKGWRKPKREAFELIANRWSLPPEQIVVVGDTLAADILGAQNAGMQSILIAPDESSVATARQDFQPTAVTDSLSALPEIIAQL
jgi:HAD superfamily hydrolase (TIGR01549 family)